MFKAMTYSVLRDAEHVFVSLILLGTILRIGPEETGWRCSERTGFEPKTRCREMHGLDFFPGGILGEHHYRSGRKGFF